MKDWIEKKALPFIERWWKPLAILAGVIVAIILGKRLWGAVVDSVLGKVENSTFMPIKGDPEHVVVPTVSGPRTVRLPKDENGNQITSDVKGLRVGYAPGYIAKTEVPSGAIKRR